MLQDTDDSRVGEANTAMIEVFIGPWPFMAMFTVKDVKKGQELLCNYGHSYWNISRENMRRVAVERERQKEQLKVSGTTLRCIEVPYPKRIKRTDLFNSQPSLYCALQGSMPLDVAQPEGSNAAAGSRDGCAAVSDVLIPSTSAAAPSASNQSLPETEVLGEDEECDEEYEDEEECGEEFDEEEEEEEDVEQEEEDQEEEEEAVEEDVESPPSSLSIRLGDSEEYAEFSGDGSGEVEGPSEEDADQDMQPEQGEGEQQQDDFDAGSGFEDDPEQADEGDGAGPSGYVAAPAPGLTGPAGGRDAGRDEAGPSTAPVSEPLEVLQRKLGSMKVFVQCKQKNLEDAAGQLPPSCNWRWVGQAAWYYNDVLEDGRERMIGPCTLLDLQKCLGANLREPAPARIACAYSTTSPSFPVLIAPLLTCAVCFHVPFRCRR